MFSANAANCRGDDTTILIYFQEVGPREREREMLMLLLPSKADLFLKLAKE